MVARDAAVLARAAGEAGRAAAQRGHQLLAREGVQLGALDRVVCEGEVERGGGAKVLDGRAGSIKPSIPGKDRSSIYMIGRY